VSAKSKSLPPDPAGSGGSVRRRIKSVASGSLRILGLIILSVVIAALNPNYLKATNLINIVRQASYQIILSMGMTMVLLTGGIDLSVGSVMTVGSAVAGNILTKTNLPWPMAIVGSLAAGLLLGLTGGWLVAKVKLPSPVATYGMLWVGRGISYGIMGAVIYGFCDEFRFIGRGYIVGIPVPIWIMVVLVIVLALFLKYTTLGRSMYAVGANPAAAKASGIRVDRTLMAAYAISGVLAALAGVMLTARLNAVDQDVGVPFLLPAIASPVMGGTSMTGGKGSIGGAVIGSLIMIVLTNGMNLLGISSLWQQFAIGTIVVLAVWLDQVLRRHR
jgi:ribose transport system permease protein